jgi:acyl carrier protein
MAVAQEAMMHGRLAIAAASVGGMKRCAQLMARYSSRRTIAGGRLLENPLWLSRLNGLTAAITAVEALVYLIAQRRDQGIAVPQEAYAACKIMAPELYWQAADTLVQCLGGRGYIETNMAPQILRDARVLRIFEGPTETLAMFLGARVLSQPAALQAFLVQDLAAPEIAQTLFETATQILQRYTARKVPFADEAVGRRQACLVIGELTAVAILLAAAQHGLAQQADPARQRAVVWTRSHFDHKCAQAQRLTPDEAVVLSVAATTAWIAGYATSIGDVEQTLAGEDQDLDALLRQADPVAADVAPGDRLPTAPAVSEPPVAATPVRHQAPGVPQTVASLQHWLCHWLAQRLQIVEATIDPEKAFADYGLDSVLAVELAQALEDAMGLTQPLDATLVWNFPTLQTLAVHLATGLQGTEAPSARTPQAHRAEAPDLTLAGRSVPVVSGATTGLEGLSEAELAQTLAAEIAVARGRHR